MLGTQEGCGWPAVSTRRGFAASHTPCCLRFHVRQVRKGDENGARTILAEKAAVKEVMTKNSDKAHANFSLAAKLAQMIGEAL